MVPMKMVSFGCDIFTLFIDIKALKSDSSDANFFGEMTGIDVKCWY